MAARPSRRSSSSPPPDLRHTTGRTREAAPQAGASRLSVLERLLDLAAGVLFFQVAPLVLDVLAAGQRDLDLGSPVLPVEPRWDQRHPLLRGATDQPLDLAPVQQQLARALGLMVLARGRRVR